MEVVERDLVLDFLLGFAVVVDRISAVF